MTSSPARQRPIAKRIENRYQDWSPSAHIFANANGARIEFTGRDTAAGKSFETWIKNYLARKKAGEKNIALEPEKLE
jgi:hypothetical protein